MCSLAFVLAREKVAVGTYVLRRRELWIFPVQKVVCALSRLYLSYTYIPQWRYTKLLPIIILIGWTDRFRIRKLETLNNDEIKTWSTLDVGTHAILMNTLSDELPQGIHQRSGCPGARWQSERSGSAQIPKHIRNLYHIYLLISHLRNLYSTIKKAKVSI